MKRYILLLVLLVGTAAAAQNYVAPQPNPRQEKEAIELAKKLNEELSFTGSQQLAVELLNGEFIARRDEIVGSQKLTLLEKNEFLEAIYVEQGHEMADILVREQINLYKIIRGDIQPLIVIVE
jgi:hypothetical protein